MGVKYLPVIKFETEFEGEHIVVTMDPIDRETFLVVQADLFEARKHEDDTLRRMSVYAAGCKALERCLQTISGLTDAANVSVTKEVVLSKVFFTPLVLVCFHELLNKGSVGKAQSSESGEKSPAS